MTRPKFANSSSTTSSRRPRIDGPEEQEQEVSTRPPDHILSSGEMPSISDYMEQQMKAKSKEPTRPITLRFEESLWQKVESLRGNLSKNDFFKFLVDYYEKDKLKTQM